MYRIDNKTAATSLPLPKAKGPQPDGYFTEGDPKNDISATILDADWCNAVQEEICAVIVAAGLQLDKNNPRQLLAAIKIIVDRETATVKSKPQSIWNSICNKFKLANF